MENEIYETMPDYTLLQIEKFVVWCDKKIGTEIEINEVNDNEYSALIVDLTIREVDLLRNYEHIFRIDEGMRK